MNKLNPVRARFMLMWLIALSGILTFHFLQVGKLQGKLRDGQLSTQEHHNLLKQELTRRDETIQQLRREVLHLQEKRDHAQVEVGGTEYLSCLVL